MSIVLAIEIGVGEWGSIKFWEGAVSYSEEVADGVVDDGGEEGDQDGQKAGFVLLWLLAVGEDEAEADED